MKRKKFLVLSFGVSTLALISFAVAAEPSWEENEQISSQGRENPLSLSSQELQLSAVRGRAHALNYPVSITGEALPLEAALRFFEPGQSKNLIDLLQGFFKRAIRIETFSDVENLVGLIDYPEEEGRGVYHVPFPEGKKPWYRMGTSMIDAPEGRALTFSCASCHAGDLFGKKVIGLTNRFPRANEFFLSGRAATRFVGAEMFRAATQSSPNETAMYRRLRENAQFIDGRMPLVRGLDTSLAHVALSLARRAPDSIASKDPRSQRNPRDTWLRHQPADSKPAVWWNVKYKNKWLLDGSVVAGNPIFTNILWNEIGRGTELTELSHWLVNNNAVVRDLTAMVFSAQAPEFLDFFPEQHFSLEKVTKGQQLFSENCAFCHGNYIKGFQRADTSGMSKRELLKTVRVEYHTNTPVVNVGTDSLRAEGMISLAEPLNRLDISKRNGILVKVQRGYVPPPLVGIWARWPYLHNNSVPNLCALLTPAAQRPVRWDVGEARSKSSDFDAACNGYPLGEKAPKSWKDNRWGHFDSRREGLSNQGHDEGIIMQNGREKFTSEEKSALIQFLQTL
ncbi:MAG: hypothetical protein FJY29_00370 [Betaproteobacteria bacterium]|nr:hypothetical protein [Betaproteobacteria bacterium]